MTAIGERVQGRLCKHHPELNGERFLRNRACPSCQNGYTKERNQLIRDKGKKYTALVAALEEVLDDPGTMVTPHHKALLIRMM
jgi:hypothetical protein